MSRNHRALAVSTLAAAALIIVPAAEAMYLKGHQVSTNAAGTKFEMTGGLIGKWKVTSFHVKHTAPVFKGKGTEHFKGCVDVLRDGSCAGDPAGTLDFRFRFWSRATDEGIVELGTCAHRITESTDGLLGATGFLMMVDTPIPGGGGATTTHWEGEIDAPGLAARSAAAPSGC